MKLVALEPVLDLESRRGAGHDAEPRVPLRTDYGLTGSSRTSAPARVRRADEHRRRPVELAGLGLAARGRSVAEPALGRLSIQKKLPAASFHCGSCLRRSTDTYGARPARLATTAISSDGSTGLAICIWNPAKTERVRSSDRAYAVSATAGMLPPRSGPSALTRRISE